MGAMERYQVFARKYRPRTFDEVVGQDHVTRTLRNAVRMNRVGHAYLFCGPRGVGKTTLARIFSKALNCARGPTTEPCGACESCIAIQEGSDPDVIEMDAASNRQVEHARALRESVGYAPLRSRHKLYILDECHMLTGEAFNTLLKTLEEPPPHVKFIFATTDPERLPDTIRSRCQRFDFRRVPAERIVERLRRIAQAEGLRIPDDVLRAVAAQSDGCVRDAESLLDQVVALGADAACADEVLALLGRARTEEIVALVSAAAGGDLAGALDRLERLRHAGTDPAGLLDQIAEQYREILRAHAQRDVSEEARALAREVAPEAAVYALQVYFDARRKLRDGADPDLLLDVVCAKLARSADLVSLDALLEELRRGEPAGPQRPPRRPPPPPPAPPVPPRPARAEPPPPPPAPPRADSAGLLDRIRAAWQAVVASCSESRGVFALLHGARPAAFENGELTLELDDALAAKREALEEPRVLRTIEEEIRRRCGVDARVRFRVAVPAGPAEPAEVPPVVARLQEYFPAARVIRREPDSKEEP
jgi:DNA polymerase-3 subunit gamma/tau